MKKLLLTTFIGLLFTACCQEAPNKTRGGVAYFSFKVCPIGATNGDDCVQYKVKHYSFGSAYTIVETVDGHEYFFNNNGWALTIVTK